MNREKVEQSILEIVDQADEMTRSDLQGLVSVLASKLVATRHKLSDADIKDIATYVSKTITTDETEGGEDLDEDEIYGRVETGLQRFNARLAVNHMKVWD